MLQNVTRLRKSTPGPPVLALVNMPLVLRLPRKMHLYRSSSNVPRLPSFLEMLQSPHVLLTFDKVHNPARLPREMTSERPKVARTCGAFNHLTSKCAKHLNFQKWSGAGVFCTFWLGNVLRATTACKFSSLIWPAGSAPSRFSEPSFRSSGATNHWKNTVFRDFPTFSRTCIFFLLTLSLLWSSLFCASLFYSSLLSDSSHLCFSSVHIVGSLTSKLPSIV